MPRYLKRRYRTWYARLEIPRAVRPHFDGKPEFQCSLKTDSQREAERLAGPIITAWKTSIERARSSDPLQRDLEVWRHGLRHLNEDQIDREEYLLHLEERATALAKQHGTPEAKLWHDRVTGKQTDLEPLWESWVATKAQKEPYRSILMRRQVLRMLTEHHPTAESVNRRAAAQFVQDVLSDGRSPQTVARMLSTLSTFWKWLRTQGYVEGENPWSEQRPSQSSNNHGEDGEAQRRPFTEDEARRLFGAVDTHAGKFPADSVVVRVQAVTGMRLDEVCALQVAVVEPDEHREDVVWLRVRRGKNSSARRGVPISDETTVGMLKQRLKDRRKDRHPALFPEYQPRNRAGSWSAAVSKRIGRRLRDFTDDPDLVQNHSWRHWAKSKAIAARLPLLPLDFFVGHTMGGQNRRYYHPEPEELIEVADALRLPDTLSGFPVS